MSSGLYGSGYKFFIAAFFSACLVLLLCLPVPARAAEPVPGGACPTQYLIVTTGGPETTGIRNLMICDGSIWQQLTTWLANGYVGIKTATPAAPLHVNGEVIVGATTGIACVATITGGLRWSSANSTVEMCDGASWQKIAASTCDNAPAFPVFTDQSMLNTSTLVSSNIVAITGMDAGCSAVVGVSGTGGSPEYRVCSTSNCSSVDINWTTANNSVAMQGKYLQLRATTSASAGTTFTITASIGSTTSDWDIMTQYADCSGNPIGTVCGDGTVYAGTSPDGSVPMFTVRCDAGQSWTGSCTGTRSSKTYDDGAGAPASVDTMLVNCGSAPGGCMAYGETETALLINIDSNVTSGGVQPHAAAQYCADLNSNGYSDWYLPSAPELNVMYTNKTAIANFDTSGSYYRSSSEQSDGRSYDGSFSDGSFVSGLKYTGRYVRCVRRNADVTPTSLSFTDQTNQAAALILSNIVQITGIDTATPVAVINKTADGTGSPQYRICSDSACSGVVTTWNSAINSISNNQYIQLRMYANGAAGSINSVVVLVGDLTDQWDLTTSSSDPCAGSPSPGAVCTDGSVYAGTSPDGSVPMYVTRCDYNQTWSGSACINTRTGITWNNGQTDWVDTSLVNCGSVPACDNSGETNTTTLAAADSDSNDAGVQPHAAAKYCDDLTVHGNSDWYLPSAPELNVIYGNKTAIGRFDISGSFYWSSSESSFNNAWYQRFSDGAQGTYYKDSGYLVRCARR